MISPSDLQALKPKATAKAQERIKGKEETLRNTDPRLLRYVDSVAQRPEIHNVLEILGVCKFLRMMSDYFFDIESVQSIYRAIEGVWDNGRHSHGGFKLDSLRGRKAYALTPLQCYLYAGIFGFKYYQDLGEYNGEELLDTECIGPDGHLLDLRRVSNDVLFSAGRKNDKSGLSANCAIIDMLFGDMDAEAYIVTNSLEQSLLMMQKVKFRLRQLDPEEKRFRLTQTEAQWRQGYERTGIIKALSAGSRTKDGLKASMCLTDEYGSASYTNGKSDMASLVQVVQSSQGPRRQPLNIVTTTAGNVQLGPYQQYYNGVVEILAKEIEY